MRAIKSQFEPLHEEEELSAAMAHADARVIGD
jgi:hypothetical protein